MSDLFQSHEPERNPTPPADPVPATDQKPNNPVAEAARDYRTKGVAVVRIDGTSKKPVEQEWSTRSADPAQFRPGENVGLLCGWASDGGVPGRHLVCVDLDSAEAVEKAGEHLPATNAIEGRPGKPRSHWWYYVTDVPECATSEAEQSSGAAKREGKHPGPWKKKFPTENGKTAIDFIGAGGQTVAPPSRYSEVEVRAWEPGHGIEHAAELPFETLWEAVSALADASGAKVPQLKTSVASRATDTTDSTGVEVERPAKRSAKASAGRPGRVQGTRTRIDTPMAERVGKCRDYLKTVGLARSGCGGHDTTYRVARIIVNDFAVTDREQALDLLGEYNQRLKEAGEEEWKGLEIIHKLDSALNAPPDPDYPPGYKLRPAEGWNSPSRLAEEYLARETLAFVKDTAFRFDGRGYRPVSDSSLTASVQRFVEGRAAREFDRTSAEWNRKRADIEGQPGTASPNPVDEADDLSEAIDRARKQKLDAHQKKKPKGVPSVKRALVSDVIASLRGRCQLDDGTELDTWLTPDGGPRVLAVANGLLDLDRRELIPHTPDWFSCTVLPVRFDPTAPKPEKWIQFLAEVTEGDAERQSVIQEVFGACLDRSAPGKWFAMLVGSGDNGKSVVLHVLGLLLGKRNCASVGLGALTHSNFAAFQLFGKLANVVGDQGFLESADEGKLKTLTGGDLMMFEQKGRDPFSAVNRAKLVFACNTLPTFGDKSEAVWNRLQAVSFTYTVPADRKNPALLTDGYWAEELPGILNWSLDGLQRFRSNRGRFTRSAVCEAVKHEHRQDSNPARRFLLETYEFTNREGDLVPVGHLYDEYRAWAPAEGCNKLLTRNKFGKEVDAAFPGVEKAKTCRVGEESTRCRVGLKKRSE